MMSVLQENKTAFINRNLLHSPRTGWMEIHIERLLRLYLGY